MSKANSSASSSSLQGAESILRGISYPASREEIVKQAQQRGASEQVMQALRQLPAQQRYNSAAEVSEAVEGGARGGQQHNSSDRSSDRGGADRGGADRARQN